MTQTRVTYPSASPYIGGYRLVRPLGRNNDVETYLAEGDMGKGDVGDRTGPFVLKLTAASAVSADAQLRLEHEAAVVKQLDSPHLTPLLDHGWDNEWLYLVTDFVTGVPLAELVATRTLSASEAITTGRHIAGALQVAHDHGVLHRDVKPANVIAVMSGSDGSAPSTDLVVERAVLVDFGLARSELLNRQLRDVAVGSVRYMAPEQAGLLRAPLDERADLYAVGLTLFECLVGRPLFTGTTVTEVLRQQMTVAPPSLRELGVNAPRALEAILQRLLRKDPAERYQSAEGLAADLDDLSLALEGGTAEPSIAIGAQDRRIALAEPAFVGRDAELAALMPYVEDARRGAGGLVFVEGESGGGKTRLLEELRVRVGSDVWVLNGQGVDQAAQRPFQVLSGVVRSVAAAAADEAGARVRLRDGMGDHRPAAAVAFPELADVLDAPPDERVGPEEFGELRTLRALSTLLDTLGTPARPGLVLLDDCQWADELSVKLLDRWCRSASNRRRHVLVIAAFRSEEVGPGHALRRVDALGALTLSGLDDSHVREVARSMTGGLPDAAADIVVRLAEGSPFMASAAVRGLVESGALVPEEQGWHLEETALDEIHFSRRAAAFLSHRVDLLTDHAQRLLTVGAVLGKQFELRLAAELATMTLVDASRAVQDARRRHMVWTDDSATRCTFVHDKLRETVLGRISDHDRRNLHRRAAQALGERSPPPVFELAFHLDAAGDHRAALPHALRAAEQARSQQALEVAEQQYRIAERGSDGSDASTALRIAEELGQVLMLRGRYEDAAIQFERALELAPADRMEARILGELGELAFKRGDVAASSVWLERGLHRLGQRAPKSTPGFLVTAAWEIIVQALHTVLPRLFVARRPLTSSEEDLLAARIYSRLAHSYWFGKGSIPTLFVHLRGMNLAERYPDTPQLAQAYSEHAPVMTLLPWFGRGIAYARRSLEIRRALGDVWGEGQSLHFYGVVLYASSQFEDCLDACREAVRLLERTGDRWEVNTARWHIAYSLYRQGDLARAAEVAREVHRSGQEIGDAQARGIGLAAWSKASCGRVPADLVDAELAAISDDVHTAAEVLQAHGRFLLAEGRSDDAVATLERADAMVRASGLRQEYVAPVQPWLLTALREARANCPPYDTQRGRRSRRRALRVARRARRMARSYKNNQAHVLREVAYLAAEGGRDRKARRLLDRSVDIADQQGAAFERALSLLARGEIGGSRGWSHADRDLSEGRALVEAAQGGLEPAVAARSPSSTVSLLDRFDVLLDAGRRIAVCLDQASVLAEVRGAALALLRGDECLVLEISGAVSDTTNPSEDKLRIEVAAGDPAVRFSRALVTSAVAARRPAVIAEGLAEGASDSTILSGARSILCAPILVRGEIAACLYVSHGAVGALFGEEEERIAALLAAIAGAALENAAGFAEVEELTRTLEQRVDERTAQLRRLNQLQTDMMGIAAHDLRTPLTVIGGFASTLRLRWDTVEPDERLHLLDRMVANTKRLVDFVENLLQFARIESGDLRCNLEPFDLGELVQRTVAEASAATSGVRVQATIPGDLPLGLGDEQRQWQVLTNLLTNAAKFSPPGGLIEVAVARNDTELSVSVRDHGPGIAPEDAGRVFEKFAQLEAREGQRRPVGTGLGLYICKSIVEAHGGSLTLRTTEGEGCTFTYTLQIAPEPAAVGKR